MKILAVCTLAIVCLVQFAQAGNITNNDLAKSAELQKVLLNSGSRETVPEIIEKHGYPAEIHYVQTSDGYILELHRVPHAKERPNSVTKGVAFLQHGLLGSSAGFVVTGDKSLGFYLSELGYDVWLGNSRGNTYSKKHISLSPAQGAFWQFSWNEVGNFDLPAMIDYVLNATGEEKLHLIGHSQGCTDSVVMAADRPEYNDKLKSFQALAPAIFMTHDPNIFFQILARVKNQADWITSAIGLNEFLPSTGFIEEIGKFYAKMMTGLKEFCAWLTSAIGLNEFLPSTGFIEEIGNFCQDDDWTQGILCSNVYFLLSGHNPDQLNATLIPEIVQNLPAGASTKQLLHYAQIIKSGNFEKYDYGWLKNNLIYGQASPPKYDLKKLTAPTYLYYSDNDKLVAPQDVEYSAEQLPNVKVLHKVDDQLWGHGDYLFGIDAIELPQIIEKHGYPVLKYEVQTADGYLLEVDRIPYAKGRPGSSTKGPVLVLHGIFSSAADFVVSGEKSLGFFLSESGYDVWLSNTRGSTNSKKHISLDPAQAAFWEFSWHEVGILDVPAMIDYIFATTGEEKLHILGHSQGNNDYFVFASERPEYNDKVRSYQGLGPTVFMKHQPNIFAQIASRFSGILGWAAKQIGLNEFFPRSDFIEGLGKLLCEDDDWTRDIVCKNLYYVFAGYDPDQVNATLIPEILENIPSGGSAKELLHFAQLVKSGKFQKFDYGLIKNYQIYGQIHPPEYNLSVITTPVYLYYSKADVVVSYKDVEYLAEQLPNLKELYKVNHTLWSHVDFLMGVDAVDLVYPRIVANMDKH
ncbi:uncharacterized protein LOC113389552 [Ctenocephalides felis]|uniref:uncharacterized protein LOC113389552 n=1 Tax=Ctenocephalides felis TaxID=7515 RepID=UPI000E6E13A9|nr:uncharacterized protein LOC113389552 [Ctenocephalides felis]